MRRLHSLARFKPAGWHLPASLLLTALFLFFALPMGPAITPDSVAYREVALNILHGHGPVNHSGQLVNHWPPLYPAALALSAFLSGLSIQAAALLLQTILFFLYILLLLRISRQCGLSPLSSILLVLTGCVLPGMFQFSRQMSEGLFNTLLLALLSLGLNYRKEPRPLLMGILTGLLFLTRYAGMAMIAGTGLFILITEMRNLRLMLRRVLLFAFAPAAAMGGWMLTERLMHAGHFNRGLVFHPIPAHKWISLSAQVNAQIFPPLQWLFPYSGLFVLAALFCLTGYWIIRHRREQEEQQAAFVWICCCAFLLLLLITCFFLDAHTPLDARIWSPLAPLVLLLTVHTLRKAGICFRNAFLLFLIACNLKPAHARWNSFRRNGEGLSAREWRESPTLKAAAASVQSRKKVYSNGADVLNYYWNAEGRYRVYPMPLKYYPTLGQSNTRYEQDFARMLDEIGKKQAVLVYFHNIRWRTFLEDSAGLAKRLHGKTPATYRDGLILR